MECCDGGGGGCDYGGCGTCGAPCSAVMVVLGDH